jgi:hypothetical protein
MESEYIDELFLRLKDEFRAHKRDADKYCDLAADRWRYINELLKQQKAKEAETVKLLENRDKQIKDLQEECATLREKIANQIIGRWRVASCSTLQRKHSRI